MFGCKPCSVKDEQSTVKVDMSKFEESGPGPEALAAQEEEKRKAAEAEKKRRDEEDARKRRAEEEAKRLRQEKERKDAEEQQRREKEQAAAEAQRREAEERARQQQEAEEAERIKQEQEREQAAAREREAAAERQRVAEQKTKEEAELREQLNAWLKKNSLADANAKKKTMLPPSHCYPLHIAVKQKDAQMVRALILCGADKNTPNSSGQTALDLANKNNKGSVLDEVIAALS